MSSALLTDFYQLTMAYGYWRLGMHEQKAVFHLFCRKNPIFSNYIVASGLSELTYFLKSYHFTDTDIDYLRAYFPDDFLTYLKSLRFTGDIDAATEGTLVFPNEPILRIQAPLIQAQLLETMIINAFNFASGVATMASRMRSVVGNDRLFEFGLRRAQGPNGGLTASRSAYLGGFDSTSNVLAGKIDAIPVVGTMAHSWIMAFEDELTAFRQYATIMPDNVVLLVDTYDTKQGVQNAIVAGESLRERGYDLKGIRLDSGDMASLSQMARTRLDEAGFTDTKIYASGELTLERLTVLKAQSAPIDGWGVGTRLVTLYEQPALDMAYKLGAIKVGQQWQYKLKISDDQVKTSDPGILQVRRYQKNNHWLGDLMYHVDYGFEEPPFEAADSEDLLKPIFRSGKCVYDAPTLSQSRQQCLSDVASFEKAWQDDYWVSRDEQLQRLKNKLLKC